MQSSDRTTKMSKAVRSKTTLCHGNATIVALPLSWVNFILYNTV